MTTDAESSDRELVATRMLKAPRALVWRAFSQPERIDQWWGPRGFQTSTQSMDFRTGGLWRYLMYGPDGVEYPNEVRYLEIIAPERIVYENGLPGEAPMFRTTITFEETDGLTLLTFRMRFPDAERLRESVEKLGARDGLQETIDGLEEYLRG